MHIHVPLAVSEAEGEPVSRTELFFRDELVYVIFDFDGPLALRRLSVRLYQEVRTLLDAGRRTFIFNLADVPFADSSGVGALIACRRAIYSADGKLTLVAPRPRVLDVLKRMRLDSLFNFRENERAALLRR